MLGKAKGLIIEKESKNFLYYVNKLKKQTILCKDTKGGGKGCILMINHLLNNIDII